MEDSPSFSLGLTQLDTNSIVDFVPKVFDYEEPNFDENRSKYRNDPNKMKEIKKFAAEKAKKTIEKSSRKSKKNGTARPRLPKFVYNNIRPTHEEVQSLDLQIIEEFELKDAESKFLPENAADRSGKRPAIDIHSQADLDIQDFEDFSTFSPTKILKKAGLITDASASQPTKRCRTVRFDSATIGEQKVGEEKTRNEPSKEDAEDIEIFKTLKEKKSVDIGPATLKSLVEAVENLKPDSANVETSTIQHIDVIFYHLRKKSKLRNDQDYRFTITNYFFKNYIEKTYSRYYKDDTDTVLTTQQDYAQSAVVALDEEAITNIIKGYCMSSGLPWHQVDEVYIPINCNEKFHWVLAVIALKDRRIRIYDSLSSLRNKESINKIQKLVVMVPTYLSDSEFFEETSHTD
ncbi:hypothetical protein BC332_33951 [Capsicum chinense]|nr:hypothetical protein BC332_33951 [Capsicum chinense]